MNAVERQGAIDTALENGQYAAAAAMVRGSRQIGHIDALICVRHTESSRLQAVIDKAMPAQSPACSHILTTRSSPRETLPDELRSMAKRIRNTGGAFEADTLDRMARIIDDAQHDRQLSQILDLRHRISSVIGEQTNSEIRRWLTMALTPGDTIVSNMGETIA